MAGEPLMHDSVWLQQPHYEEAEAFYYAVQSGTVTPGHGSLQGGRNIKNEITQARAQIAKALTQPGHQDGGHHAGGSGASPQVLKRLDYLEKENKDLKTTVKDMQELIQKLETRLTFLEKEGMDDSTAASKPADAKPAAKDDDEDFDLFGDDGDEEEEEDDSKKKVLEEYKAKKAKKPQVIAKSSVILDVKPWDDETDMAEIERLVRTIQKDGLVWGVGKLVDLAYGIKKLTIICVVEDEKISIEDLKEEIEAFEDFVQSVDIAAFNKI